MASLTAFTSPQTVRAEPFDCAQDRPVKAGRQPSTSSGRTDGGCAAATPSIRALRVFIRSVALSLSSPPSVRAEPFGCAQDRPVEAGRQPSTSSGRTDGGCAAATPSIRALRVFIRSVALCLSSPPSVRVEPVLLSSIRAEPVLLSSVSSLSSVRAEPVEAGFQPSTGSGRTGAVVALPCPSVPFT